MIEESEAARERLNRDRTKPLRFDFRYYFIDADPLHTEHLRTVLNERGYANPERVILRNSRFEDEAATIITAIRYRQPRAGRAIFLLDQTGFSRVELALVARILRELPAAEVILTFAADALINHLTERPAYLQAVSPLELTERRIQDLIRLKDGAGGRALFKELCGIIFATPPERLTTRRSSFDPASRAELFGSCICRDIRQPATS